MTLVFATHVHAPNNSPLTSPNHSTQSLWSIRMGNPFIPLSKAAIKADLSKNEGLIFIVLTMQTIGYRKITDNLTDKRLAQLTGIRLDHLRPCLERFLQYGLFERIEHKHYDYQYRLCDEFLDEGAATILYSPSFRTSPAIGEAAPSASDFPEDGGDSAPRSGSFTEDGGHTTENPYIKKQQHKTNTSFNQKQQQTEPKKNKEKKQQTKPKKNKIKKQQTKREKNIIQQQPQAAVTISMAGLEKMPEHFVIESSQPVRIEFSTENVGKVTTVVEQKSVPAAIAETVAITENTPKSEKVATIVEQENVPVAIAETIAITKNVPKSEKVATIVEQESVPAAIAQTVEKSEEVATAIEQESVQSTEPVAMPIIDSNVPSETISHNVSESPNTIMAHAVGEALTQKVESTTTSQSSADLAVSVATTLVQPIEPPVPSTTEEPPVVVNEKQHKKRLVIPNTVGEENFNACNRYFDLLNESQKQDVLDVFFYNLKLGNIRNKASYFIGLTEKVKKGNLTVPSKETIKNNGVSQGPLSYEQSLAKKEADKKHEEYSARWGDYMWIQRQAKTLQKSEAETAKMMGLEEAYMMFSEKVAAAAQQNGEMAMA